MKKILKELCESRVGKYVIYGSMYLTISFFWGFEYTVIMMGATIIGELDFQSKK